MLDVRMDLINWLVFNAGSATDRGGSVDAHQISTELIGQWCIVGPKSG